jgi:pimeloyl-ACP methyl ester carboxylesterase
MSRLAGFVGPLTAAGYRVVAYDHPAHGASDGKRTTMLQCADALHHLGRRLGPIDVVIGHSFGGPTAALAGTKGLPYRGLVMLASPLDMIQQTIDAGVMLGIPRHVAERMARELAQRLAVDWTELETDRLVGQLGVPILVVHDRHDPIVPFREGEAIAAAARHGRLMATEGLGHRDLLSDPQVQRLVVSFVNETAQPAPARPRRAARKHSADHA